MIGDELERCNVALNKRAGCNAQPMLYDIIARSKKIVGRGRVERPTPAMSRRYPNQARPPALCTMQKFAAQIYVVDLLLEDNVWDRNTKKQDLWVSTNFKSDTSIKL
jgi:hypothetical protein